MRPASQYRATKNVFASARLRRSAFPSYATMTRLEAPRAKLIDVARAAQVSVSVASRALGGYSDVAEATRERVRLAAAALGYRPSWRARALVSGKDAPLRCAVIGVGVRPTELGNYFLGPVFAGIMDEGRREGMEIQLITSERGEPAADAFRRVVAEDRADGF